MRNSLRLAETRPAQNTLNYININIYELTLTELKFQRI